MTDETSGTSMPLAIESDDTKLKNNLIIYNWKEIDSYCQLYTHTFISPSLNRFNIAFLCLAVIFEENFPQRKLLSKPMQQHSHWHSSETHSKKTPTKSFSKKSHHKSQSVSCLDGGGKTQNFI